MAKRRGANYQSYYGRRSSGAVTLLKWIIVFLLAVLVVAIGVYYMLQEGLVVDDNGVHVVPPWDRTEPTEPVHSPEPSPPESPSESLIVIEPDPTPSLRDLAMQTLQAVEVTQTVLLSGHAGEQARTAGGNAVLVEMKKEDGTLSYISSVPLAVSLGSSGSDGTVNQAVRELTEGEVYTVAKVSCFRDHLMGTETEYALLTNSGWRWRDNEDVRWTCPANADVQAYLTAICTELAQMGFDEILLTNCGYPTADLGNLGWIRKGNAYPAGELDTVLGPFLAQLKAALEPYGTRLSVAAVASELAGEANATGLTLDNVTASCDHFWVDAQAAAAYSNFAGAPEHSAEKLVPMSTAAGTEGAPWALLSSF